MKNENREQKELGLRIKSARVLTGLNQEEFAHRCGFNYTSLRNWEFGRFFPRADALSRLVEAFNGLGVFTSLEWIRNGSGEGPMLKAKTILQTDKSLNISVTMSYKKSLEALGAKPVVITVHDNNMRPLYNIGDILGAGIININEVQYWPKEKQEALFAQPVLVDCDDLGLQPRWLYFDGIQWWSKKESDHSIKMLSSNVIGVITLRYQNWVGIPSMA